MTKLIFPRFLNEYISDVWDLTEYEIISDDMISLVVS